MGATAAVARTKPVVTPSPLPPPHRRWAIAYAQSNVAIKPIQVEQCVGRSDAHRDTRRRREQLWLRRSEYPICDGLRAGDVHVAIATLIVMLWISVDLPQQYLKLVCPAFEFNRFLRGYQTAAVPRKEGLSQFFFQLQ